MRSLFAGMIMLSASMAVVDIAQAQIQSQTPPGYGSMQAPVGHRQPTQYSQQPTQDDLEKIDKENQELDLPASQDEITGAGQVRSNEDALTNRIGQENPALDSEILDICPTCGGAEDAPAHQRSWPVHKGFKHHSTQYELRALHQHDVARGQPQETGQLFDRLTSEQILGRRPARAP
jgi:hypothetical protein